MASHLVERALYFPLPLPQSHWANIPNGDMWSIFDACIRARGANSLRFTKVKGHSTAQHIAEGVATKWTHLGNTMAVELSTSAREAEHGLVRLASAQFFAAQIKAYIT